MGRSRRKPRQEGGRPASTVDMGRDYQEWLFLETLADLERKLDSSTPYGLVRASGLLRQLLTDGGRLVHLVNREYRLRLEFVVPDGSDPAPFGPMVQWVDVSARAAQERTCDLDRFLAYKVLHFEKDAFSVKEIIRAVANKGGGVHLEVRTSTSCGSWSWTASSG